MLTYHNVELEKYFSLPPNTSPQVSYKQLVSAASEFLLVSKEVKEQIEFVEPLYKDRLVSDEYYDSLMEVSKSLELEKMVLESEWGKEQLFQDAAKLKNKVRKTHKVWEDQLFTNKREVLENELRKKLIKSCD